MRALDTNPWLEAVRAAYRKSDLYARLHRGEKVSGTVGAALPREPGSDDDIPQAGRCGGKVAGQSGPVAGPAEPALGIAWDPLEIEMMDKAQR